MAKKGNRKVPAKKRRAPATSRRTKNRRGGKRTRKAMDPAERKARNRTVLLLGLLAAVNAYVFLWRGEGSLADLSVQKAAVIGSRGGGPLGTYAEPPADACGSGSSLRIFAGLGDLLRAETNLRGDRDLEAALRHLGVAQTSISGAVTAIRPVFDLALLRDSNTPLRIASDRFGGLQALELELGEGHVLQACRGADDSYTVRTLQHPPSTDVAVIDLELGRDADLLKAIADAGEAPELADRIAEALAYDVDLLTDARPHDAIKVVVEKRFLGRAFHRYGPVLGIRFAGEAANVTYLRHRPAGGEAELFTREGEPRRRQLRRTPVGFHRVSPEARGLLEPTLEVITGRTGAMFRRPEGAPVVALADAVVRAAGEAGDAGQVLELELDGDLYVRYAHLARVVGDLRPGDRVRAGELVGLAGHSGKTASDRVRLEMWREEGGEAAMLDPLFIQANGDGRPPRIGAPLEGDDLDRFREDTISLRRLLR
ncbi:MAG: M23 family metallopeptidase [Myxococcales bacterium]|nr:M23 family metallopeptidase [Myxococcales bacterium]